MLVCATIGSAMVHTASDLPDSCKKFKIWVFRSNSLRLSQWMIMKARLDGDLRELHGHCSGSLGLQTKDLAFIYFDAYDDLDSPDVNENGYLDAMGLSMLRGESWKTLMRPVPGFEPFDLSRFLYCGLQDQSSIQRQRVIDAGMHSIWGGTERKVYFATELKTQLEQRSYSPALVHLDLDVLDDSYGKVNDFPSPGGLLEADLVSCMELVPKMTTPKSLTVCSFDLDSGDGDKIARIAIRAITSFVKSLLSEGALLKV
ncbi:hypothetical protein ETB97_012109 [Aspergillus alliaceus]|uniref:Arginase n=1 Tax=Petromyces alliaceus TaxID=209559 RepID=A0A8H6E7A1_PETAA|nr:hypothetical protein ETB97_012109 [Aspergillus burnettii]